MAALVFRGMGITKFFLKLQSGERSKKLKDENLDATRRFK